jgi:excisionase family DNA binding protein
MPTNTTSINTDATKPAWAWLTAEEIAAYAGGLSVRTIYAAVRDRQLRAARVGGRRALRFRQEWADEWLTATATPVEIGAR